MTKLPPHPSPLPYGEREEVRGSDFKYWLFLPAAGPEPYWYRAGRGICLEVGACKWVLTH